MSSITNWEDPNFFHHQRGPGGSLLKGLSESMLLAEEPCPVDVDVKSLEKCNLEL